MTQPKVPQDQDRPSNLQKDPEDWKPINHACDPNAWLDGLNLTALLQTLETAFAPFDRSDDWRPLPTPIVLRLHPPAPRRPPVADVDERDF